MNKMLLLGIVVLGMMMSCSKETNTRTYKVMTLKNINLIATSEEPVGKFYIFNVGDTVMMDAEHRLNKGRTRVVITERIK